MAKTPARSHSGRSRFFVSGYKPGVIGKTACGHGSWRQLTIKIFITSTVSRRMENGESSVIAGKSGIEIASDIVLETTGKSLDIEPEENFTRSREYWIGWAVAYYQWYSARKTLGCTIEDLIEK